MLISAYAIGSPYWEFRSFDILQQVYDLSYYRYNYTREHNNPSIDSADSSPISHWLHISKFVLWKPVQIRNFNTDAHNINDKIWDKILKCCWIANYETV